jgi:ABC-type methionine transport system ATPase subunit
MLAGVPTWTRAQQARELLDAVGLPEHAHKRPAALSGGQQQRVAIAVALANRPALLLADEPTGALDRKSAAQVMDLLRDLRERYGLTILMAMHDLDVASHADRVLTLRDGSLGQELAHEIDATRMLDDSGRIQLPEAVRAQLVKAAHIAVEIRPEGVLLRPEAEQIDDSALVTDEMVQDAPPERRQRFRRLFRCKQGKPA